MIASAIALIWSTLRIGRVAWVDAWPWILLGVGAAAAFGALVVQSYAPPGPNLVERAMAIEAEPVLVMAGIGLTTFGTAFWFDFGDDDSGRPSDWWIALIAFGIVLLLIGVLRTFARAEHRQNDPLEEAAGVAQRARRAAAAAEEAVAAARATPNPAGSAPSLPAIAMVVDTRALASEAERLADRSLEFPACPPELLQTIRHFASEAERSRDFVEQRLKRDRNRPRWIGGEIGEADQGTTP
ncbi:MAG: hypothetical protein ACR2QO_23145 [Acidimicrobiales bacterium]